MRAYTVAATAAVLGVSRKWVDNVLSHHQVTGVFQKKQGIARRVTPVALLTLDLTLQLSQILGTPISYALSIADRLIATQGREVDLGGTASISLRTDIEALQVSLQERLEYALEATPSPQRGRPHARPHRQLKTDRE
jgi:hypothetical protein